MHRGTAIFDLAIHFWERGQGISGGIEYSTTLFDDTTIARLSEHLLTLLESAVLDPDAPIAELPLLSPSESHRVIVSWNRTEASYADQWCFHHVVEAHAAATPDAIALRGPLQSPTYGEMNQRANRVACSLRRLGVSSGSLVLLCVERSVEMVTWTARILKAGAAFVPLDASYPGDRWLFTRRTPARGFAQHL